MKVGQFVIAKLPRGSLSTSRIRKKKLPRVLYRKKAKNTAGLGSIGLKAIESRGRKKIRTLLN